MCDNRSVGLVEAGLPKADPATDRRLEMVTMVAFIVTIVEDFGK
jgi:hypothetical protein